MGKISEDWGLMNSLLFFWTGKMSEPFHYTAISRRSSSAKRPCRRGVRRNGCIRRLRGNMFRGSQSCCLTSFIQVLEIPLEVTSGLLRKSKTY